MGRSTGFFTPLLAVTGLVSGIASAAPSVDNVARAKSILKSSPLIDGHNDLPYYIRENTHDQIYDGKLPFETGLSGHTDLKRIRKGGLGGQFWSVYMACSSKPDAEIDDPFVRTPALEHQGLAELTRNWDICSGL